MKLSEASTHALFAEIATRGAGAALLLLDHQIPGQPEPFLILSRGGATLAYGLVCRAHALLSRTLDGIDKMEGGA